MTASDDGPSELSAWHRFEADLARVAAGGLLAPSVPATVLLTGEIGSGKSRAARRLHDLSPRAGGPFVAIHLAGLAPTLLEAELFGHTAGAFTGASRAREGRFERAAGGTVVLEAIETLDVALQVKLLRVLQEREVEPLGAEAPVPIDVRVIATTARDLRVAVEAGTFREDLYFRLAVVPLQVPALRLRTPDPDFVDLCAGVIRTVAERVGAPERTLTPGAVEALRAHPWPGNLRELENAVERLLVLGIGGDAGPAPVTADELEFLREPLRGRADEIAAEALAAGIGFDELDAAVISEALRQERGNVSAAARRVGLSRRAFDYRRKRLGDDGEGG
ncbi:MAG: sigma 54-interacting transcriptional regulator [Planctomycetota bacterium]